jgi:hypothetical protein
VIRKENKPPQRTEKCLLLPVVCASKNIQNKCGKCISIPDSLLSLILELVDKNSLDAPFRTGAGSKIHIPRNDEVNSHTNVGW